MAKYECLLSCAGYIRNTNNRNRAKHDGVHDGKIGDAKKRSKWQLFSLADWIWTWQFANGWTMSPYYASGLRREGAL